MLGLATSRGELAGETRGVSPSALELSMELRRWSLAQPLQPLDLPDPSWVRRTGTVRGGELGVTLRSVAFRRPGVGHLRTAELMGAHGLYIANLAFFPEPGSVLPIAQAEFIEVKGRLMLVIADLQDPLEPARPCGAPTGDATLPPSEDRPPWSLRCFSRGVLWSTPRSAGALTSGKQAMLDLLAALGEHLADQGPQPRSGLDPTRTAIRAGHYQRLRATFLAHEPSRPMLHGMFGEAWSEAYMAGFLFPPDPWQRPRVSTSVRSAV